MVIAIGLKSYRVRVRNLRSFMGYKLFFVALTWSSDLLAGAPYCALRDPSHQIYSMFPSATSYRSVVREVDEPNRLSLDEQIPFSLHYNELGVHTIYVPVREVMPLGIVHVRSEMSDWGLVEIVWALDYQIKIADFAFQRCRGSDCKAIEKKGLKKLLLGKGEYELIDLLDKNLSYLNAGLLGLNDSELRLASVIVKSAIKTIAVTKNTWPSTVAEVQSKSGSVK